MGRQQKIHQEIVTEAKQAEKEYLRRVKEKDMKEHITMKNRQMQQTMEENKLIMRSMVEKDKKDVEQWRTSEDNKKKVVKEVLTHQIIEHKKESERRRQEKLEEVS